MDFAALIGASTIWGGEGSNYVVGDGASQTIFLGADDDQLYGGGGDDVVRSAGGNDKLHGDDGDDTVGGGIGNDSLYGGDGTDKLDGGEGDDVLTGGDGDDLLEGGKGKDTASYADAGSAVTVTLAKIRVDGHVQAAQDTEGAGTDTLIHIENLEGSDFDDTLTGNGGANRVAGGDGDDSINAGRGSDTLVGGLGEDTLQGGGGRDKFLYQSVDECGDHVLDFGKRSDKFQFASDAFGLPAGKLEKSAFLAADHVAAQTADQHFLYDTATSSLYYDADGNGTTAAVLVAVLDNHAVVGAGNIVIV